MSSASISFWSATSGTWLNVATVLAGSLAGLFLGRSIPEEYSALILQAFGLYTICLGVDAAVVVFNETVARYRPRVSAPETYGPRLAMIVVLSLALGSTIGTSLKLQSRIEATLGAFGAASVETHPNGSAQEKSKGAEGDGRPQADKDPAPSSAVLARGFVTAFVLFCVGPLTLLGCLRNGFQGDSGYLQVKSVLDGFSSLALASKFGVGVILSVPALALLQGGLSLLAWRFSEPLSDLSLRLMAAVGGVLMLGTGFSILEMAPVPVADMVPALFLPPLLLVVAEAALPGRFEPAQDKAANSHGAS